MLRPRSLGAFQAARCPSCPPSCFVTLYHSVRAEATAVAEAPTATEASHDAFSVWAGDLVVRAPRPNGAARLSSRRRTTATLQQGAAQPRGGGAPGATPNVPTLQRGHVGTGIRSSSSSDGSVSSRKASSGGAPLEQLQADVALLLRLEAELLQSSGAAKPSVPP
ncbi:hypothetical protein MNEG_14574, partial [Monoraphidium neglectum]